MFCVDPSLTLLAKYGYNVVRMPRTGIEPLDVFGRDRAGIERLGSSPAIWHSEVQAPKVDDGNVAAELKTVTTASLKTSIGLRVLDNILSGLGATVPRLDFAYSGKRSLQFSFGNIEVVGVDPFDVGQYLKKGDLQVGNPWVDRYFFDDEAEAFIITEVLKSDTVTVSASSEAEGNAGVDVKAVQGAVGAAIAVQTGSSNQTDLIYKGQKHLTFGFKAFQISYAFDDAHQGHWGVAGLDAKSGKIYLEASSQRTSPMLLANRDGRTGRVDL